MGNLPIKTRGEGIIHRLKAVKANMGQLKLTSTFMLWMLARLYETLRSGRPASRSCFFFDEAHLLFDDASGRARRMGADGA